MSEYINFDDVYQKIAREVLNSNLNIRSYPLWVPVIEQSFISDKPVLKRLGIRG